MQEGDWEEEGEENMEEDEDYVDEDDIAVKNFSLDDTQHWKDILDKFMIKVCNIYIDYFILTLDHSKQPNQSTPEPPNFCKDPMVKVLRGLKAINYSGFLLLWQTDLLILPQDLGLVKDCVDISEPGYSYHTLDPLNPHQTQLLCLNGISTELGKILDKWEQ